MNVFERKCKSAIKEYIRKWWERDEDVELLISSFTDSIGFNNAVIRLIVPEDMTDIVFFCTETHTGEIFIEALSHISYEVYE